MSNLSCTLVLNMFVCLLVCLYVPIIVSIKRTDYGSGGPFITRSDYGSGGPFITRTDYGSGGPTALIMVQVDQPH